MTSRAAKGMSPFSISLSKRSLPRFASSPWDVDELVDDVVRLDLLFPVPFELLEVVENGLPG